MHRLAVGALAGFAALAGCLGEKTVRCSNGALCPAPLACTGNTEEPFCAERGNVEQCQGKPDETPCTFGSENNGYCLANACTQCNPNFSFCRYDEWTPMTPIVNGVTTSVELKSVWAASPTDLYVVGIQGTMIRWDGRQWSAFTSGVAAGAEYESIWGFGASAMYVVTVGAHNNAYVFRYDGAQWNAETQAATSTMRAVWGTDANNVFVVGLGIGHYVGSWVPPEASSLLQGVWGNGATAIAVGSPSPNNAKRFTGTWAPEPTGTTHFLNDVAGADSLEFAVGRTNAVEVAPAVLRHDASWVDLTATLPSSVSTFELNGVSVLSPTDVYVVGDGGTILHYDGAQWTVMSTGVGVTLNEIFATSTDLFVVGKSGTVLRRSR